MNSTTLPNTNRITRWMSVGLDTNYQKYFFSGHLTFQRTVNEFAIWRASENASYDLGNLSSSDQCSVPNATLWETFLMPMPTPAYSQNPFFLIIGFMLGLLMVMSFLYPVSR